MTADEAFHALCKLAEHYKAGKLGQEELEGEIALVLLEIQYEG